MDELSNEPIIVKFKLEPEDFVQARISLSKSFKTGGLLKGIGIYIILFVIILAILTFFQTTDTPVPKVPNNTVQHAADTVPLFIAILPTISLIFIFGFLFFGFRWLIKYGAKKHYYSNKILQKEMTYVFTDEGFECNSESSTSRIRWEELHKITESKKAVMLFASNMTAWIIPKRFFNGNDFERFVSFVYPKFPKKKIKKAK